MGWLLAILKEVCLRVPTRFRLEHVSFYLDGGTIDLWGRDEQGHWRRIRLTQHVIPRERWADPSPGRLYLGWRRVPMRGRAEALILALVERLLAEQVVIGPAEGEMEEIYSCRVELLRGLLEYVRSPSYGQEVTSEPDDEAEGPSE